MFSFWQMEKFKAESATEKWNAFPLTCALNVGLGKEEEAEK